MLNKTLKIVNYNHYDANLAKNGMAILKNVKSFPVVDYSFVSDHMVINICISGYARVHFDIFDREFHLNEVAVILPGHIIKMLETSEDYCVLQIIVARPIIDLLKQRISRKNYAQYIDGSPLNPITEEQKNILIKITGLIEDTLNADIMYKQEQLTNLLEVFFTLLECFCPQYSGSDKGSKLYRRFCELVAENYKKTRSITFYAHALNLTPKYFTKLLTSSTNVKPSVYIADYVTMQAKHLLKSNAHLSISEIAEKLGFPDQASFSRFFKNKTGITPNSFRHSS
ncbi:MAG: helix-turn-helix domain-containing protein [Paludibacteraceae bacterium]|nr:helix-turn-helix domain-containing protein [Paludibacteraceae bacterium]